jgi:hypothetical protein
MAQEITARYQVPQGIDPRTQIKEEKKALVESPGSRFDWDSEETKSSRSPPIAPSHHGPLPGSITGRPARRLVIQSEPGTGSVPVLGPYQSMKIESPDIGRMVQSVEKRRALAKEAGVYKGRKPSLTRVLAADLPKHVRTGDKKARLATEYLISRQTLYSTLG